jgi:type II secretory pathway predicted ATPase ExeA
LPAPGYVSSKAFQPTTDPKVLWRSGQYAQALSRLRTAIASEHGLLLLLGEVGTGKTILTNALVESLAEGNIRAGKLVYPSLHLPEFRAAVAEAFGLPSPLPTPEALREQFQRFLDDARGRGERVLLVVEEAQALSPELFAEIQRLLEADAAGASDRAGILSILLVGQNDLGVTLHDGDNCDLTSRIKVRCELEPLGADEVAAYMRHCLAVAGMDPRRFTADAVREVVAFSHGIPRLINVVCDRALARANLLNLPAVTGGLVRECAETFDAPAGSRSVVQPDRAEVAARRLGGGAKPPRRALVVTVVGLVAVGVILPAGYAYWRRGEARWKPVPMHAVTPARDEGVTKPLAGAATVEPSGVPMPEPIQPPAVSPEPEPQVPRVEQRRTRPLPRTDSASVRGREQRAPRATTGHRDTTTGGPSGAAAPEVAPVVITPSLPPPRTAAARGAAGGGEEPDPGAIIDWLLRESPRRTD